MTRRSATLLLTVAAAGAAGQTPSPGKTRGVPMAAVTIEVFSDFQCPACKSLHEETLKPLVADYVDKGKVYLVHRDFPLPMHAYAREAACLACAAGRVGKYELIADTLFSSQGSWSKDGKVEDAVSRVLTPADAKKVLALSKTPEILAEVERDAQKGRDAKLQQTPTMIVMHKSKTYPVAGVVSYPILRRFIDQLLTQ
jgi:protein-disulfide isomerase